MADRSAAELWSVLEAQAREDELVEAALAEAIAMSDQELEASLARAGFQVADVERMALAVRSESAQEHVAEAVPQQAPVRSIERRRMRRPGVLLLAAAATTAAVGGLFYASQHRAPEPVPAPAPTPPAPPPTPPPELVAASDLRTRAAEALQADDPARCLELLDQAKALDPAGDTAPDVIALRERATAPLIGPKAPIGPKGPSPRRK